jgi:hypothetical protein
VPQEAKTFRLTPTVAAATRTLSYIKTTTFFATGRLQALLTGQGQFAEHRQYDHSDQKKGDDLN